MNQGLRLPIMVPIWQYICYKDSYRKRTKRWSPGIPRGSTGLPLEFLRKGGGMVFQGFHLRRFRKSQGVDLVILGMSRGHREIQDPEEFVTMGTPKVKSMYSWYKSLLFFKVVPQITNWNSGTELQLFGRGHFLFFSKVQNQGCP